MKSEAFWNRMAGRYDHILKTYQKTYDDTIRHSKNYLQPGHTAMDIGCGSGIATIALANAVKEIYAVDTSAKMMDIAQEKANNAAARNVRFFVADIFDRRWENGAFDVVMAYNLLCYIRDADAFLARIYGLLKPDGVFLSATDCFGERKYAVSGLRSLSSKLNIIPYAKNFSIRELETMILKNHFEILESRNLHEGVPNLFIAAKKA